MTAPEELAAALHAAYPTPDSVARAFPRELDALEQTLREAEPHWHTPLPGRDWSTAQEAEHALLVNEGSFRIARLLRSDKPLRPGPREPGRTEQGRRLAPPGTEPGAGEELDTLLERLAASREQLGDDLFAAADPQRTFFHPFLGDLDALDWLRMATWHTRSHRQAIERGLAQLRGGS